MNRYAFVLSALVAPLVSSAAFAAEPIAVSLEAPMLESFELELAGFARALPADERAVWTAILRRAATVPSDRPSGVRVAAVLASQASPEAMERAMAQAAGIIVQGHDPHALIGPKPEDPHSLIGPKPEDPHSQLGRRVRTLSLGLSFEERVALDWLLGRAGRASHSAGRPGTPGGLPPGLVVSLGNALGVRAIGPKQDDPAPPPPQSTTWTLLVQM